MWCFKIYLVLTIITVIVCYSGSNNKQICKCETMDDACDRCSLIGFKAKNVLEDVCGVHGRYKRIVGGQETNPHGQPWSTALMKNNVLYCGATIISTNYLLTAAHCIYSFSPNEILVYIGGHKIIEDHSEVKYVSSVIYHEQFDAVTFDNDIGLIRVGTPITYGPKAQPACLPINKGDMDYFGDLGLVTGWGRTGENQELSAVLQYITVPIWTHLKCQKSGYGPKRLTGNMMCAGFEEGLFDACQGDSGGSMLRSNSGGIEIIGITSWGRGCARPNYPGVYTIVKNYRKWIDKFLSSECLCSRKE